MKLLRVLLQFVVIPLLILGFIFLLAEKVVMPTITRHGSEFSLPNVVGSSEADAFEQFDELGLKLIVTGREYSPNESEGIILTQSPMSGSMVKEGRSVKVVISAGERISEVPDIFGLPLRQASLAIAAAGFEIGDMYWVRTDSLPENVAVETIPSKGSVLPLGSMISLAINQGSQTNYLFLPRLVGMSYPAAAALLDSLHLVTPLPAIVIDTLLLPNTVTAQIPVHNTQVETGDTVWLTISETD